MWEIIFYLLGREGEIAKSLLHSSNPHLGGEFGGEFVSFQIKIIHQEGNFAWKGVKTSSVHLELDVVYMGHMKKEN